MSASPPKSLSKTRKSYSWITFTLLLGFLFVSLQAYQVHALVDSDGDGLSDDQELLSGTDANNPDTDGDGMLDGYEVSHSLNPLDSTDATLDYDHDGLSNLAEYTAGTNINNMDSDGDRITDGYEVSHGMNPLDSTDASLDSDMDGASNLSEYHSGTDVHSHDTSADADGDGIPNADEDAEDSDSENHPEHDKTSGSSSNQYSASLDTDGDGFSNLEEYIGRSNPNDSASMPSSYSVLDSSSRTIRMVVPPNVTVSSFTWIDPATLPASNTPGLTYPYGLLGMTLNVTIPGEHIKVALTFPGPVDPLSAYDHFGATITDPLNHWVSYSVGSNDGDATIILNLADGGDGDEDTAGDGTIHDPGGPALLTTAKLVNISTRASVQTGSNVTMGGFYINGTTPKTVMIRGRGPSMGGAPFNISGTMANPSLKLYSFATNTIFTQNDDWQATDAQCDSPATACGGVTEISATALDPCQPNPGQTVAPPNCSRESALYVTLPPGGYSAILSGVNGTTGVGLVEVFEVATTGDAKLVNISTRSLVQTGSNVMMGGIYVNGTTPKTLMIRARGGSMSGAPFNISGTLANPSLKLYSFATNTIFTQNDDWQATDALCGSPAVFCGGASAIKATKMDPCQPNPGQTVAPPNCSRESALYVTLPPGGYSAIVSGVNGGTGVGLVEVFEVQ